MDKKIKTMFMLNFVGDRRRSRRHNSISQIDVSCITKGSHLAPPGAQSRDGLHKVASAPNVGTAVKVERPASPVKTSASTTPSSSTESEIDEKERSRLARKYVVHTQTNNYCNWKLGFCAIFMVSSAIRAL